MKDYFEPVPKEFDYAAFIDELIPLVEQARAFDVKDRQHGGDVFTAWRHKVEHLIIKIGRTHMDAHCDLSQRQFRVMSYSSISAKDQLNAFDRDMRDTLVELDHIIDWYKKYGEPKLRHGAPKQVSKAEPVPAASTPLAPKPVEPEWPREQELTLYWLFKKMPLSAWAWFVLFVGGAFAAGVTVGSWPVVQKKLYQWVEPGTATIAPTPPKTTSK